MPDSQSQQLSPFFAIFMCIWATAFLKSWQRRSNRLALRWGVINREQAEVVRKQFYGGTRVSRITHETELYYPTWKRGLKQLLTSLVILCQLLFIIVLIGVLYAGYFWIQSTEMPWLEMMTLNLLNSTIWGVSLEYERDRGSHSVSARSA